jgi:arsenite-transporting ATPase
MDNNNLKFQFFTGKGGVGKTSIACAIAVKLADQGKKVLLISTDPASNLSDVLDTEVSDLISVHQQLANLFVVNIDPDKSANDYRERVIAPLLNLASDAQIRVIQEGLSGACTTEIASFDEFSRFITNEGDLKDFDHVIFDTAPTGHTIRLLELPAAWDSFLENNPQGASCIGPSSALKSSKSRYKQVITSLKDPNLTTFHLVARADRASLKEAARTSGELNELGFTSQTLSVNGIFKALDKNDPFAKKIEEVSNANLEKIPQEIKDLPRTDLPLLPYNILGLEKLRSLFNSSLQKNIIEAELIDNSNTIHYYNTLNQLVDQLESEGNNGLIMTMGKGGVGKTIVASYIATLLAQRGHKVLLTTTDPAAHINDFINQLDERPENLTVERIDPKAETKIYIDNIYKQKSVGLNEDAKKLLLEDLKSPCNQEVAVFNAFSKAIQKGKSQFVVLDTAPTGHTLLLLDTTGSYHNEIMKTTKLDPKRITTPYMSLQNPELAKILLVALPETTPMREAEELQKDLERAGIKPYAWVINQCLSSVDSLTDPILLKRASNEVEILNFIENNLANRMYNIPYLPSNKLLPSLINQIC